MIKIVHFKISLKLKQKYLFEKLYFLKIYHFYSLGVVCIFHTFLILSKEYLYLLLKITMKENLYSIISYRQPHRVCNYDFLLKWKIQKLLIMYIDGSSIILTKKCFPPQDSNLQNSDEKSDISFIRSCNQLTIH